MREVLAYSSALDAWSKVLVFLAVGMTLNSEVVVAMANRLARKSGLNDQGLMEVVTFVGHFSGITRVAHFLQAESEYTGADLWAIRAKEEL